MTTSSSSTSSEGLAEQRCKEKHDLRIEAAPRCKRISDKGRIRIKTRIGKVYTMVEEAKEDHTTFIQKEQMLNQCGFGAILQICNWNGISTTFVKWVVDSWEVKNGPQIRLSKSEVLQITEDDVHRIYHLPRGEKEIDLAGCRLEYIQKLKEELELEDGFPKTVHYRELENGSQRIEDTKKWTKCAILYIMYCLLCPLNSNQVDLRYAEALEPFEAIQKYNWCAHVLEHTTKGITEKNKLNPTADFHFLLINYLERIGKNCRLLAGQYMGPSLRGWDETVEMSKIGTLDNMVGLSYVVSVGVTKDIRRKTEWGCCLWIHTPAHSKRLVDICPCARSMLRCILQL